MMLGHAVSNDLNPLAMGMIWGCSASGKHFICRSSALIAGYMCGCYSFRDVLKFAAFFLQAFSSIV